MNTIEYTTVLMFDDSFVNFDTYTDGMVMLDIEREVPKGASFARLEGITMMKFYKLLEGVNPQGFNYLLTEMCKSSEKLEPLSVFSMMYVCNCLYMRKWVLVGKSRTRIEYINSLIRDADRIDQGAITLASATGLTPEAAKSAEKVW